MKWRLTVGGRQHEIEVSGDIHSGKFFDLNLDGVGYKAAWHAPMQTLSLCAASEPRLETNIQLQKINCEPSEDSQDPCFEVFYRHSSLNPKREPKGGSNCSNYQAVASLSVPGMDARLSQTASSTQVIKAPMAGTVIKVLVEAGQKVEKGQILCVIEAMKMENQIKATMAGTVGELFVDNGTTVTLKQKLCKLLN